MAGATQKAMQDPIFSASVGDTRADRGRREIAVSPERVVIRRRMQGIDMRLTLAVSAYRGVALCLTPVEGALVYQLVLVHRDADLSVVLDEAADDQNIVADWRLWARVLGVPALVEREIGTYAVAGAGLDAETLVAITRRKRPLQHRPRFLARRRAGQADAAPTIYADEVEIIARS